MQTARADAVRDFKATQSFINFCAGYYGTGFDDCLKQVASAFPELDLSGITMDDGDDGSSESTSTLEPDSVVVLAQPAANPLTPASNIPAALVDVSNHHNQSLFHSLVARKIPKQQQQQSNQNNNIHSSNPNAKTHLKKKKKQNKKTNKQSE